MFSLRPHSNDWLPLPLLVIRPLCRPHVLVVNAFVAPIPPFASAQTGKYSFPSKTQRSSRKRFSFPNFQTDHKKIEVQRLVRLQIIRKMRPLIVLRVRVCHRSRLLVIWATTKETKTRFYGYSSHSDFTTTNPLIYAGRCSPLTTHATSQQSFSSELPKNLRPNTRIRMSILRGNQIKHKKLEADQKRTKALLQRKMDWVGR